VHWVILKIHLIEVVSDLDLKSGLKHEWQKRSWWMNVLLLFCLYMTFIYSPFDVIFKPVAADQDVWFGYMFVGWAAKVGGVAHWLVYGALAWGLWHMRPWVWPWAAVYATQVAIAMFAFTALNAEGAGLVGSLVAGAIFMIPAVALWRSRSVFQSVP
jgi:hypothetical protein